MQITATESSIETAQSSMIFHDPKNTYAGAPVGAKMRA
jgi:hypothetical protein